MNMETLALYKKHKVNPVGSCFPLLLQMPIFFGLYGALNHSLDLFQAPFFMWITDLSSRDPFFVFPALWTISLVAYVFLNPMPQNNQQGMPDMKWIMISMNIFFGYLSKDWPAGLTLYLFVSNLVGITQQMVMQRATKKLQPIQEGA
jgi:YidC/Oxa1 family membrane protein insertase